MKLVLLKVAANQSLKTAVRSSCKSFETKAKTFDDDKDDGDGVLITLPNKNRAWKKFDKHFFFQKYLFIFLSKEFLPINIVCFFQESRISEARSLTLS
jgi:hypothetical protein